MAKPQNTAAAAAAVASNLRDSLAASAVVSFPPSL